ncbi:MAG TPA: hybrid sensor histidine kinase/response regulator [Cyanobacteria bacterium UBA11149]|nr:hybrid sensor histidine kinase/response regulator [Cyanobacteria bacterium UBA11367]HBE56138.1 hybrid sensor histidine kinase/response regulator [Cyanobacteria bacterium UBA11366]HBK65212.1 hybrid sensor histidine kinase/response regulator [Cyanobacteria bacterium UBA11166]HBR76049.1 hybrid sensor histidine kinase/response regulator [Cyanobacteria bacterium UBA11159]HBS69243.1 hybrid sensor histidine kinase/response regulator [Cyanobacteria bacterium UBA11153]HBW88093.1 hybrid sensor histid
MVTPQKNSILVVDDTPNNIRVLFDVLRSVGFNVSVVKSGELALEKLSLIQPDLILLDVMMPGIDGFETCRRLKTDPSSKDIPVIFMTVLSDVESKVKGLQIGAVDYITKPIQVEEVLARVKVHLALRNTQIELKNEVTEHLEAEMRLQQTINELQKTQTQLIQSEKMSALGELVSGVAHEINNPVNFIGGNIIHASEYTKNLLKLIKLYQEYYPNPVPEISEEIQEIELDYLRDDLPKLLHSMEVGVQRLQEIVLSLRIFSRTDDTQMKPVDIHQGIDSTLMILGHRLKANKDRQEISIIKNYGNLPLVECYIGRLNQVFMNILTNAIDGLEQAINSQKIFTPFIIIKTEVIDSNFVIISISDNGLGIPKDIQKKIFEPFFTTKSSGTGTGIGLAISQQIIAEKHHGSLECFSEVGEGSEFRIIIPLQQEQ